MNIVNRLREPEFRSPRFWWSWLNGNRLTILMYHSIANNPSDPNAVSRGSFSAQMQYLADHHWKVVSLEEGMQRLQNGLGLRKFAVITFDDGYIDFLTTALPILQQFSYPATMFVPTGLVGGRAIWDSHDKSKELMNWEQVREVTRRGVAIGSHTITHAILTGCNDRTLEHELAGSLTSLRERFGSIYPALAYPSGAFSPREMQAAEKAGFVCGLGTCSRWGNGPGTPRLCLRRESPSFRFRGLI
jgi:peptidoglycan/xylan/chitin deacetylase (PgdA/CDA1 family)